MAYRHIIWDWNGTLLDDRWLSIEAMNRVLARRSLPLLTEEKYLEIFTFPVIDYYRRLGFDFEQESFTVTGTEFIQEYTGKMYRAHLHLGARELLKMLTDEGLTHSLLSAASQPMLESLMDHHRLRGFFQKILGQDNHYAYGKELAGKNWIRKMDYRKEEVLFVGDSLHDLEVATALGVDCILLSHGHTAHHRLVAAGGAVLKDTGELRRWFEARLKLDSNG